jgi:hypothetical protein
MIDDSKKDKVALDKSTVHDLTCDGDEACSECGHYPLTLVGTKTLCMHSNKKAFCSACSFEEHF